MVSAGQFTKDAAEFAKGRNIELIDQVQLMALVQEARSKALETRSSEAGPNPSGNTVAEAQAPIRRTEPKCPTCGSAMIERVAKRGANVGNPFWGCSTYPKCRGTLPIAS